MLSSEPTILYTIFLLRMIVYIYTDIHTYIYIYIYIYIAICVWGDVITIGSSSMGLFEERAFLRGGQFENL